jgi:predicted PurR-regulated permease PerM
MLLTLILPLAVAIFAVVVNIDAITGWITSVGSRGLPPPPDWLDSVPFVGAKIAAKWGELAAHPEQISATIAPYARSIAGLVVVMVGSVAVLLVQFLLIVGVSALLYAQGEAAADLMRRFAVRIAGARGERSVRLAGQAIRSVAMGIVVTALVQAVVAGAGLAITGVPFAAVLSAVILLLCIVQLGPILVLIPAVVWLYWSGDTVWGTVLLVWSLVVGVMDNVLRPILIRKGADLPLPLIIGGVIGGLISFGIVGLFIGPVVLAVTYTLLVDWVQDGESPAATVPR